MEHAENETIVTLRQVGVFLGSLPSNHPANELSSAHPQRQASSSRFLLVPVSSGYDQHRLPGTLPGQAKARSLHKPPAQNGHPSVTEPGKKKEENSHL